MHWDWRAALFAFGLWLLAGGLTLGLFELVAFSTRNPTFSAGVWGLLDAAPWLRWPLATAWLVGAALLGWHFFGQPTGTKHKCRSGAQVQVKLLDLHIERPGGSVPGSLSVRR